MRARKLNAIQALALGFAAIILLGALLLMLPVCSRSGTRVGFLDALFTATSATCVTGLVVFDTYTQFTPLGQLIILLLIQTGGLGFMMGAVLFSLVTKKRFGLQTRSFLMESVSASQIGGVVRLAKRILLVTAFAEGLGAVALGFRFVPMYGAATGIWYAIFHAVSAFCNAGFDLMGRYQPYTSLMPFAGDPLVILTVSGLILTGGLGFVVWDDLLEKGVRPRRWQLHTKIVLTASALLVLVPWALFWIFERDGALRGASAGEAALGALFSAVTPRTAGFNSVDTAALTQPGAFLTMLLMFIGGSPGSTAGGVKLTTVAVLVLSAWAYVRKNDDINVFRRRLEDGAVRKASSAVTLYLSGALACCLLLLIQQDVSLTEALFESLSAIGTVGMSRGITRDLTAVSKVAVLLLMYVGRVGSLSVAMAFVERGRVAGLRKPEEKIIL